MTDLSALVSAPGPNDVPWTDAEFPGRPLTLRSARPARCTPDTPVVFVHHGVLRNGGDYRDFWLPLVDEAGVLAIVPEFSAECFPGPAWYNHGNLRDAQGVVHPRARWTYGIVPRLFEALRAQGVTRRRCYAQFGHSAGGQFVHRALSLGFRDRVAAAISANAGNYSWPTLDIAFPFGLGGTGATEADLEALLRFRLTVMAGTEDTATEGEHVPRDAASLRQGPMRHARAHNYVAAGRAAGDCAWTVIDVPGVAHDGCRMSAAAAPLLAAALYAAEREFP